VLISKNKYSLTSNWSQIISLLHLDISSRSTTLSTDTILHYIRQPHLIMDHTPLSFQELLTSDIGTCIGYTDELTHCNSPISKGNLNDADGIRDAIRSGADTAYVGRNIPILATLCLCKRRHQWQEVEVAQAWKLEEATRPSRPRTMPSSTQAKKCAALDQIFVEMDIMDAEMDRHDREMRDLAYRFKRMISEHKEIQSAMGQDHTL
jgi:hypothetical protein